MQEKIGQVEKKTWLIEEKFIWHELKNKDVFT